MVKFDSEKALLIILGASAWPQHEDYKNSSYTDGNNPFQLSVNEIEKYFVETMKLPNEKVRKLFNSEEPVEKQVEEIESFLKNNNPNDDGDLLVYYVGHGQVAIGDGDYFLYIRNSKKGNPRTFFSMVELFDKFKEHARFKRSYIIVDACYSGMVRRFAPESVNGTILFCASSETEGAKIQKDSEIIATTKTEPTLFTGYLLKVLQQEATVADHQKKLLSCHDVNSLLSKCLGRQKGVPEHQYYVIGKNQNVIGNLEIFPNPAYVEEKTSSKLLYPMSIAEKLTPIKWHITTSNKGGVGKTLLSMMLLTHYSSNRPKDKAAIKRLPLVVDLNGVNMDIKRLLGNLDLELEKDGQIKRADVDGRGTSLAIVKVNQKNHPFLLGWPTVDPFKMLDTPSFFKLLEVIKGEAISKIKETFPKVDIPVVIIDTNYHFCNIFSDDNTHYEYLKEFLWDRDQFFIWFIWVYGQLRNLIQGDSLSDELIEKQRMELVSEQVENFLAPVIGSQKESPFFHVLNPIGLKNDHNTTDIDIMERLKNNLKFLMWGGGEKEEGGVKEEEVKEGDVPGKRIDKLDKLFKLVPKGGKNFVDIQENMIAALEQSKSKAQTKGGKKKEELVFAEHERTQNVLLRLEEILKMDGGRPKNLVPIPIYHEQVESYQDAEHISLSAIRRLEVYTKFRDLLNEATKK
ncbi:MAG: hypothetical protein BWK78_05445 [Thiotrichaceae bacterium IS1]|nr:MAG: hypothetical protein BWK78_05445 [Thiotrichaceae bacterium IS1]